MAKKIKLRDYQKSILDKLEEVRVDTSTVAANYLGVEINGRNVLVDLLEISETLVVEGIQPVPLVKPWFLGMTNVRGVLYAMNDLAQLLDHHHTVVSSDTRMLLINENIISNMGILVDKLIGLRNIKAFIRRKNTKKVSPCFKQDSYVDKEKKVWYVLDCEKLVASKDFEVPYAA
ncbi:MAG: chemotaxis protein CheW [Methylophilaceae bacterium]